MFVKLLSFVYGCGVKLTCHLNKKKNACMHSAIRAVFVNERGFLFVLLFFFLLFIFFVQVFVEVDFFVLNLGIRGHAVLTLYEKHDCVMVFRA